jgi:hypothetical protein
MQKQEELKKEIERVRIIGKRLASSELISDLFILNNWK